MGAPKQRWTSEEEAALKAGINKYGVGKWSTILKDPEFNAVLRSRSNVDLKDKWRNLNGMANGLGSRNRASAAHKNSQLALKHDESTTAHSLEVEKDSVVLDTKPLAEVNETVQDASFRNQISSVDDLIFEAITKLKEPRGSSQHAIARYIEDHHLAPPDFQRILAANLKVLTGKEQLVKVRHQYRIAPRSISLDGGKAPPLLLPHEAKKDLSEVQQNGIVILTKADIDAELEKMRNMTAKEAAAAAAQAVAEAEAAIAAAEAAALAAEEAEVEAEAAQCFADAAQKALNCISIHVTKSNP